MNESKFIELGYCSRPHGIKGGFSLVLHNLEDSVLKSGMSVKLVPSGEKSSLDPSGEFFEISSIQLGNKAIIFFKGVDDRNLVESMIPFRLFLDRNEFPELEGDQYYLNDLLGLEVFNENGKRVGSISSLYDNGANTVVVIKTKSGDELELPLVEAFFIEVDIENNKVIVNTPEVV